MEQRDHDPGHQEIELRLIGRTLMREVDRHIASHERANVGFALTDYLHPAPHLRDLRLKILTRLSCNRLADRIRHQTRHEVLKIERRRSTKGRAVASALCSARGEPPCAAVIGAAPSGSPVTLHQVTGLVTRLPRALG